MSRLYISNSKYLFIAIVFSVICGLALTQAFYDYKNAPVDSGNSHFKEMKLPDNSLKTIIYLGDSRASASIVPDVLRDKIPGYEPFCAGARGGNIFTLMDYVQSLNKPFGLVIICVSPASLFGAFVHDSVTYYKNIIDLTTPAYANVFNRVETKLTESYLKKLKFLYGFSELKNLILYNEISHYYTKDGWESISVSGDNAPYARAYNYYGYKYKLLCNSGNAELLSIYKNKFSSYITLLSKRHKVILVRLPVADEMKNLEESRFPWFDDFLKEVSVLNQVKYISSFNGNFTSDPNSDWSHISHHQAIRFSETLSDTLRLLLNR